jgi:hypothetical protein
MLLSHKNNDMGFEGKGMQLKDIMLSEAGRLRNTKAAYFLSFMEDRSKNKHIHKKA